MSYDAANDDALARRAAAGCLSSFEQLVSRFQVPLVHFLQQRTRSLADAEDLTQETLLRAYRNLHRYDPARPFCTWLYTIARRVGLNHQRDRAGRATCQAESALASFEASGADPSRSLCEQETRDQLWRRAAELLSDEKCEALWLFYVEDLPVAEIANIVGRSPGAVKTMLCRARQELRRHFALDPDFSGERREVELAERRSDPTPNRRNSTQPICAGFTLATDSEGA